MNIKKIINKKSAIVLGTCIFLLVLINILSFTVSRTSNADTLASGVVSHTNTGVSIQTITGIQNKLENESYYYTLKYNVTEIDPRVEFLTVESKSTSYSFPLYAADDPLVLGENILVSEMEIGNEIATITTTINFYGDDGAGNRVLLDLSTLTVEGDIDVIVEKKPLSSELAAGMRKWEVPITGTYRIELWGAQGNYFPEFNKNNSGKGAYVAGDVKLTKGDVLYIYTGGNTNRSGLFYQASFNGGSTTQPYAGGHSMSSGGGATDIRYFGDYTPTDADLKWNSTLGLRSRIMVAGGGGGTLQQHANPGDGNWFYQTGFGGSGGGLVGLKGKIVHTLEATGAVDDFTSRTPWPLGGSQTSGGLGGGLCQYTATNGSFGIGGNGAKGNALLSATQCALSIDGIDFTHNAVSDGNMGGGGGGGYYGGGGGSFAFDCHSGGAGGSSFISGFQGAVAVDANGNPICTEAQAKTDASCSIHYSGLTFTNTSMIDGDGYTWNSTGQTSKTGQPTYNGGTQTGQSGTGEAKITLLTEDECTNCAAEVTFTKYERRLTGEDTTIPVAGAVYSLYHADGDYIRDYVTDENGIIKLTSDTDEVDTRLVIGKEYYLIEKTVPEGYELDPNKYSFTGSDTPITVGPSYDKRLPGVLNVKKINNIGDIMSGVKFELYYMKDGVNYTLRDTYLTDLTGQINVGDLDWGDYYIVEAETKEGYVLDDQKRYFTIGAEQTRTPITYMVVNEQKRGEVYLTKYNSNKLVKLAGAKYDLYNAKTDALLKSGLVTDENGSLHITDLVWGSYYLKEVEAPTGYGINMNLVKFAINNKTCSKALQLEQKDPALSKKINVTKKIKISDIIFDHGDPTFIFNLVGTDINDVEHYYNTAITFTQDEVNAYVTANPEAEYISKTAIISELVAGNYTLTELDTVRYAIDEITDVLSGTINGEKVDFDLTSTEVLSGAATYSNEIESQGSTNHTNEITNKISASAKLVAIISDYDKTKDVFPGNKINRNNLKVYAYYDDGSEELLTNDKYTLDLTGDVIPKTVEGDSYSTVVTYTEGDIMQTDVALIPIDRYTFTKNFGYTGGSQSFRPTKTGNYILEVWGAQGGSDSSAAYGGYGGYAVGVATISNSTTVYIYVGGAGSGLYRSGLATSNAYVAGGYNGGSSSAGGAGGSNWLTGHSDYTESIASGGGATHISFTNAGITSVRNSPANLLIAAGGGGGASYGYGNNVYAGYMNYVTYGASGGGAYNNKSKVSYSGGYAGGWALSGGGGGFANGSTCAGSCISGGTGYIANPLLSSKAMYCHTCTTNTSVNYKTISVSTVSSNAISNTPKAGNGYARITYAGHD